MSSCSHNHIGFFATYTSPEISRLAKIPCQRGGDNQTGIAVAAEQFQALRRIVNIQPITLAKCQAVTASPTQNKMVIWTRLPAILRQAVSA